LIKYIEVSTTSEKQIKSFKPHYKITGSTKAVVSCTMGYPKWQFGNSSVKFDIKTNIEYKVKISPENLRLKPRHSTREPYLA
jgi:hypothetical protein